jgi:aspartate beta-hydroxylase
MNPAAPNAADVDAQWQVARAALEQGRASDAHAALTQLLQLDPSLFIPRLHLGRLLEDAGQYDAAVVQYFGAVMRAQSKGRWRDESTTAPHLRDAVLHAMDVIDAERQQVFRRSYESLRAQHGDAALARVDECLHIYLHEHQIVYPDPRQQPKFLYFPGLPATPYFARELFPWYAQLESNVDAIRDELQSVLRDAHGIEPFLKFQTAEQAQGYLAGTDAAPSWDAFFFYRHGVRNDANCARCPRTAAILDALPLVRIREHAPEVCFSVLTPGTHILPHRGVTNVRLVTHLPLIVPEQCVLTVGGEARAWREGECFTFDDTFEHEAWNRGSSIRVVMLLDCWNPHLTEVERAAVSLLVAAIGDFNHAAGISDD